MQSAPLSLSTHAKSRCNCSGLRETLGWLPGKDSNLEWLIQSQLCYHYTTRQRSNIIHKAGAGVNALMRLSLSQ